MARSCHDRLRPSVSTDHSIQSLRVKARIFCFRTCRATCSHGPHLRKRTTPQDSGPRGAGHNVNPPEPKTFRTLRGFPPLVKHNPSPSSRSHEVKPWPETFQHRRRDFCRRGVGCPLPIRECHRLGLFGSVPFDTLRRCVTVWGVELCRSGCRLARLPRYLLGRPSAGWRTRGKLPIQWVGP